jgi:tripartite ATP-independent transporter DctM subunit
MTPHLIGLIFLGVAIILLCLGVHIGLCLMLAGVLGILAVTGSFQASIGILRTTPYHTVASFALTVVPLFIIMGHFSVHGGISERAYRAIDNWLGKLPGGLSIATTWGVVAFGATSGSSVAAASAFTKISLPEMKKAGYEPNFACASIATAALIDMLIPPSLYFVIYGVLAEQSIAALFIAGILPGILMAVVLSIGILIIAANDPRLAPPSIKSVSWRERISSIWGAWSMMLLVVIIIGGIYTGIFSPTEAAAVGAFAAFIICLGYRRLNWKTLTQVLFESAQVTAMLAFLIIGATVFARFLGISGVTNWMGEVIIGLGLSPLGFVIVILILIVLMGCFIDGLSIMYVTMPIFFPVARDLGIDPIWFGVLVCITVDLGMITPPFGLTVYTVKAVAGQDVTLEGIFRRGLPFYFLIIASIAILVAFPQISLFLPGKMSGK